MIDRIATLDRLIDDAQRLRRSLLSGSTQAPPEPATPRPEDPWLEPLRGLVGVAVELDGAPYASLTLAEALAAVGASPQRQGTLTRIGRALAALGWSRRRLTRVGDDGRRGYHYVRAVG